MFADTFKFLTLTRHSLAAGDSTRRIALGIAMGMMIGLVPKDSLFTYMLFVILMTTTANLLAAFVSGFVFSWVGFAIDSFTHKLGGLVLTHDSFEATWAWLYDLPLVPWTRFNNTVVMGSLILAILLFVPVYFLSHRFFNRYGSAIHCKVNKTWIYRWLVAPAANADPKGEVA